MDRPAEMLNSLPAMNSTLTPEEVRRWRFSGLMDYSGKQPVRDAATCIATYEPLIAEAQRLADEYKAEAAALPSSWVAYSSEESRKIQKERDAITGRAYQQAYHANKLREQYSHELAFTIWWNKERAHRLASEARAAAYAEACAAHRNEQRAFELAQADEAIAAMPALPEPVKARLRILIAHAVARDSTYTKDGDCYWRERDGPKRRVMRGVPLVHVGKLPHPKLPPAVYSAHIHAF